MKAMVLKAANTPFVLETVPDPVPGPGEAVARVLACGSGDRPDTQCIGELYQTPGCRQANQSGLTLLVLLDV